MLEALPVAGELTALDLSHETSLPASVLQDPHVARLVANSAAVDAQILRQYTREGRDASVQQPITPKKTWY